MQTSTNFEAKLDYTFKFASLILVLPLGRCHLPFVLSKTESRFPEINQDFCRSVT